MAKICINEACKATATSPDWKRGWGLESGGFATLCYNCGSAFENSIYCESFHREESGWRECKLCGKHIHCGCIASKDLHKYLDSGGIRCMGCSNELEKVLLRPTKVHNSNIPNGISEHTPNNVINLRSSTISNQTSGFKVDKGKHIQLNKVTSENEVPKQLSIAMVENKEPNGKKEGTTTVGTSIAFAADSVSSLSFATPFLTYNTLGRNEVSKFASSQQGKRAELSFPKLLKCDLDANKGTASETRVPRPPAEGRGQGQLLPRYWPRITDQELQQISGDLNSTIEPLFEKVLSASDAGRIGRLVLPKACAEAYFPPILQSEGVPIIVQDIKGNEWKLQFRFWPNNNSRMYVLEGVTPCIQNMNLEAGDTVTFSRINPGGKLVIGCRKSSNSGDMQVYVNVNLPTDGVGINGVFPRGKNLIPKKKKTRNIGSKNKRLHMDVADAMELRVTWEETQDLIRPPPSAQPNIVMIENQPFEEYKEPPVFGKRTIFTSGVSGNEEQWVQCDNCFKWRKLPLDFLVPQNWTCSDNIWDPRRCSCSATAEMNPTELEGVLRVSRDFKKQRVMESPKVEQEKEGSRLDALATAAFLGENTKGPGEPSTGPTTKHPRHRPGCTCIVCIQPPSGTGKHRSTCICNVCLSVNRRFRTLMLRKKERKVENEMQKEKEKPWPLTNDLGKRDAVGNGSGNTISVFDLNRDPNKDDVASTSECPLLEEKCASPKI